MDGQCNLDTDEALWVTVSDRAVRAESEKVKSARLRRKLIFDDRLRRPRMLGCASPQRRSWPFCRHSCPPRQKGHSRRRVAGAVRHWLHARRTCARAMATPPTPKASRDWSKARCQRSSRSGRAGQRDLDHEHNRVRTSDPLAGRPAQSCYRSWRWCVALGGRLVEPPRVPDLPAQVPSTRGYKALSSGPS